MAVQEAPNPLIHKVTINPGNETRKAKTRLDEIFEEREERAAKRFSAAELEKMALEAENEAARLRGEPPKYKYQGGGEMDEEKKKQDDERRQRLMTSAKALIESGMEPVQVGQMLLGLNPTGASPVVTQGMGFDDVMKIVTLVVGKKETDELKEIITSLDKRLDDLVKNPPRREELQKPTDPITFAKQQAEAALAWHNALSEMIPKSEPRTEKGEPLEVVKERNRHDEKMEEIKVDRDYKTKITDIAGDATERVGRGLASQLFESEEEGGSQSGGELRSFICTEKDCGAKIYITPETKDSVTCGKCGMIYSRGKTPVETKTE